MSTLRHRFGGLFRLRVTVIVMAFALPFATLPAAAQDDGRAYLSASTSQLFKGQTVAIDVRVEDVENVATFQATITWDPERLEFMEGLLGDFLESSGRDVTFVPPFGEPGRLTFAAYSTADPPRPGASGDGVLFGVSLRALVAGEVIVGLPEVLLSDTDNLPQAVNVDHELLLFVDEGPTIYLPSALQAAEFP